MLPKLSILTLSIGLAVTSAQTTQVTILSATAKQVKLSWTAVPGVSSYSIYRQPTLITSSGVPGSPPLISTTAASTPVATVNATSFTDTLPDPTATYTYCVSTSSTPCTGGATVGPPPFGFNVVIPSTDDTAYTVGVLERMEIDGNGDPALAYYVLDPNGDGDDSDDTLYFVNWNRAQCAWNPPVAVAVTGSAEFEGPIVPISLARDASNGTWGLAYTVTADDGAATIMLGTSTDGGATWKSQSLTGDPYYGTLYSPSLALWNGNFYITYLTDDESLSSAFPERSGFAYLTGAVAGPSSKWKRQAVPFPHGYTSAYYTVSLALDSSHNPGIAFNVANDTYLGVAFWRAGTTSSTLVGRNDGYTTNANPAISLAFFGTEARIVTDAPWNYNSFDPDHEPADLWAMRATNTAGTSWMTAVDVPPDNVNVLELPWIATGSQGQTAIVMASNHDPEGQGMVCGFPKIARSSDFLVFQTCAPALVDSPAFYPNNMNPVVRFGTNDKLWLAFNNNDSSSIGTGLILWREQ